MNHTVIDFSNCARDHYDQPLVCSGCAHAVSGSPFPGRPSGERPCCFCVRNVEREKWLAEVAGKWYDGSPAVKVPQDNYHSIDMKQQIDAWCSAAREKPA